MTAVYDRLLLDLFTTAIEGGVNYWCDVVDYHWYLDDGRPLDSEDFDGFYANVNECGAVRWRIDRKIMASGYRKATSAEWRSRLGWSSEPPPLVPNDEWDFDAGDADMVVQLGLFGDVRYG